jgi:hypothetical protein
MISMKRSAAVVGWLSLPAIDLNQADADEVPHRPLNGIRALEAVRLAIE